MENCKNCEGWLNKQNELDGYSREGICIFAKLFNTESDCNELVLHNGVRKPYGGEIDKVTGEDWYCPKYKPRVLEETAA